ncbi:MAG: SDR family oxidoreductase [Candidatus Aminicenantes bacterium]|nr:MAG: SDR family oxidoreductase [Candidatus Aminicenantes bacterium]
MYKYLVTGGAGFIGSHIVGELVHRGQSVRIVDNFSTGKKENIAPFLEKIELIEGDIKDFKVCQQAAKDMDFILHQAALTSVPRSIEDPLLTNEVNITGTLNLLLASRDAGVQRFVLASSAAVYGDNPGLPKKEDMEGFPLSPYAASKRMGELYCQVFNRVFGLSTVSLRYFNIFGPRQDPSSQYASVIPNFIGKMLKEEKPVVFGDGEQSRDFLYVSNVVEANILASQAREVSGEVFNIGSGERTSVNALVVKLNEVSDKEIKPTYGEPRPGDIKHSYADISKARKMLKYEPSVSFSEGLGETVLWYKEGK